MRKNIFISLFLALSATVWADGVRQINLSTVQADLKNGQTLYLDFYGPNIFRLFQDPNGGEIRDPESTPPAQILVDNPRKCSGKLTVQDNTVSTTAISVSINPENGQITVSKDGSSVLTQVAPTNFQKNSTDITFAQGDKDYFYGGGVQNGRFSHKGQIIPIVNTNNWVDGGVASPTPFYWSTAGYGIMWNTFVPGSYDFGATKAGQTVLSHETNYLDIFVMIDKGAVALLNDFYQLTGNPVLLPKFGFYEGHLNAYNRDYWTEAKEGGFMKYEDGKRYNESQKDNGGIKESLNGEKNNYQFSARAAIDRYIQNDYPLGWFLPNDGYGAGYGQTGTLDGNIQNLKEFGDYARSKGVEIGLWTQSDLHPREGVEALLQRDIVKEVRDAGVRVLKTDVAWVGAGYSFGLNGVADVAQIMPYYGNNARPFIISLDGWAGTQRYAGIWTGDQTGGDWEYIRFHIPTYIGSGLSGQPNITSDMDGIFGGKNTPVNIRDFQWKTFSPMQLNMDGWGSNPKYPQALGEPASGINRWYLKLKSILLPYTYSIAHEAVDGKPMIRAMFLEDENDYTLGKQTQYQFMYGPYMLVAPIYKNTNADGVGNDVRDGIYLPKGQWVDFFTGDVVEGGRIINGYPAPINRIPLFIKRGAIIPTANASNNPSQIDRTYRAYRVYPGPKSQFTEYDDDGTTQAYLHGQSATTQVSQELSDKGVFTFNIQPTKGTFSGQVTHRMTYLMIALTKAPKKVSAVIGKKKVTLKSVADFSSLSRGSNQYYFYDYAPKDTVPASMLFVNLQSVDVATTPITVTVEGVDIDTTNKLLKNHGTLSAPKATLTKENIQAYSLTPSWDAVAGADYYEILFQDQNYSTIQGTQYQIDGLTPETAYSMKVRAVNADGASEWTELQTSTVSDPLQFAIHGARGETTCENQPGQGTNHLFDFDEASVWHTAWANDPKAVPFDLTIDLHSVNVLDKLQYLPRPDVGNGTILEGSYEWSLDRLNWTSCGNFTWNRDNSSKELTFAGNPTARYIRLHVTKSVGDFGSGQQIYIFRVAGSDYYIPGDINHDNRIDENDLTSYLNYTGLRKGDGDFDYISQGDLNKNNLIDAYDISNVAIELESGVGSKKVPSVAGTVTVKADKAQYAAGDEVRITLTGKGLQSVNALSMCIPYDPNVYEYVGVEPVGLGQMYNMTYDRLHTDGHKALYPTFVNLGEQSYTEGDKDILVIKFKAKQKTKYNLKYSDGMILDKYLNVVKF